MAFHLPRSSTLVITLVCASLLLHVTQGVTCPQTTESPVLNDKVMGSEVVVQGEVKDQVKVTDSSYTARVKVLCVFKGGPVGADINVTGAGRPEDSCVQTDLVASRVYLVYLNRVKGAPSTTLTPSFTQDPAERKYFDELRYSCGLDVQLPQGVKQSDVCKPEDFASDYMLDEECPSPGRCPELLTISSVIAATVITCWTLRLFL